MCFSKIKETTEDSNIVGENPLNEEQQSHTHASRWPDSDKILERTRKYFLSYSSLGKKGKRKKKGVY